LAEHEVAGEALRIGTEALELATRRLIKQPFRTHPLVSVARAVGGSIVDVIGPRRRP
jgi:hypothetical protein